MTEKPMGIFIINGKLFSVFFANDWVCFATFDDDIMYIK